MIDYFKLLYYMIRPNVIILRRMSHGMGDNLLMSMFPPVLKRKNPDLKIIIQTPWKTLFAHNPFIDWVTDKHIKSIDKTIRASYLILENTEVSLYEQMMSAIGEKSKAEPSIFLTDAEKKNAGKKFDGKYITICPSGKQSFSANRKEWGFENFQNLINIMDDYSFVQIGGKNDRLLDGVQDARGLEIRESAAVMSNSLLFIGLEGGLMHLSKAVGIKGVIIYGGLIKPAVSGYDDFVNIYRDVECSPCFHSNKSHSICETMICMKQITPEDVKNEIINKRIILN